MTAYGQIVPEGHILVGKIRYDLGRDANGNLRYQVGRSKEWRYAATSMQEHAKKAAIGQNHPMFIAPDRTDVLDELARLRRKTNVFADQVYQPTRVTLPDQKPVTTWAEEARTS